VNQEEKLTKVKLGSIDMPFFILVMLLMSIGLVMTFSASYASAYYMYDGESTHFVIRQSLFAVAGLLIMFLITRLDYQYFKLLSIPVVVISIVLLVLVLFIGKTINGSTRWIYIGPVGFQPSELAKLGIILAFATMISVFKEKMRTFRYGILPFGILLVLYGVLLILQPHLSCIILIGVIGIVMMYVGGMSGWWIIGGIGAGAGVVYAAYEFLPHVKARFDVWNDPWLEPLGAGYQTIQSMYALGSGGLFGLGLGQSRQKFLYLPEAYNDYVFAIVCEELGYIGALMILALFVLLIIRGYWIAIKARDQFGSMLVVGITTHIAIQTLFNIAVVTNFMPVTGVSLPFFSYGGTSLMLQLAEMGIVLAVSRQIKDKKQGD